jgi:pyridoxamine 5'-phosphate oxidase
LHPHLNNLTLKAFIDIFESMKNKDLSALRREYEFKDFTEINIDKDPIKQFQIWLDEAIDKKLTDSNAMFLATSTKDGHPSIRTILLKGLEDNCFIFFTNYESRKGIEINENPNVSLLFFWRELERQVRIDGVAEKISRKESEIYFHSRPYESQIAAYASTQSKVISNRDELEKKYNEILSKYEGNEIPLPGNWGGYKVIPNKIEFWQGRQNRLHDRVQFSKTNGNWKVERLAP